MTDKRMKVLVVDDEESLCEILMEILIELGYDVAGAHDGVAALEKLKDDDEIDIVLTDIKMPRMNGLELVQRLTENYPDIISIVMTGYIDSEIVVSVLRAGAYDFIPKPYDAKAISLILERSVGKRKMVLENKMLMLELQELNSKLREQSELLKEKIVIGDKILERKYKELKYINDVSKAINSTLGFKETLHYILTVVREVVEANTVSIMLLDEDKKYLSVVDTIGKEADILGQRIPVGEGISGWVAEHRKSFLIKNIREDLPEDFKKSPYEGYEGASFVSLPLSTVKQGVIGVLNLTDKANNVPFDEEDLDVMTIFAEQAAVAIENAIVYQNLEQYYVETIQSLANAIEAKDEYTRGHSERVTIYALELAEVLGYSEEALRIIRFGGILHDVGKIAIEHSILAKPSKLTDDEFVSMKKHPVVGADIVQSIKFLQPCLEIIRNHHERLDGRGYPDQMTGASIPENVRIVTIADAFDAMTSKRPYREALPTEEAIRRLRLDAGTQFDTELVEVFVEKVVPNLNLGDI